MSDQAASWGVTGYNRQRSPTAAELRENRQLEIVFGSAVLGGSVKEDQVIVGGQVANHSRFALVEYKQSANKHLFEKIHFQGLLGLGRRALLTPGTNGGGHDYVCMI